MTQVNRSQVQFYFPTTALPQGQPASQPSQVQPLTTDTLQLSSTAKGAIPAQPISLFSDNTSHKFLTQTLLANDLSKYGDFYKWYSATAEVADYKQLEGNTVEYRVKMHDEEAAMIDPEVGSKQGFYSTWTGTISGDLIVNRQPQNNIQIYTGGKITDGQNVSGVRVGQHHDFERIVVDVKYGGGYTGMPLVDADQSGSYQIFQSENEDGSASIYVEVNGARGFDADIDSVKGSMVQSADGWPRYDDSAVGLKFNYKEPVEFKAYELKNPARLVIDVKKK